MRAIVEISGKQYPVQEGRYVLIDSYNAPEATAVTIDKVQLIIAGEHSLIGAPYVEGASVKATVKRHGRSNKVLVYKMRCKKGYRRKNGHRQGFTELQIESLDFPGKDKIVALLPKEEPAAPKVERAPKVEPAAKLTNSEKNQGSHTAAKAAKPAAKAPKAEAKAEPKAEKAEAPKAKASEEAPKAEAAAATEAKPKKAAAPKAKAEASADKPAKSTTAKKSTKKADDAAPAAEAPTDSADKGAE